MKKLVSICLCALALLGLSSCGGSKKQIIVGTMAQPGEPILKHIEKEFEEKTGYDLVIQLYTDFAMPNEALKNGEIDANLFQHQPFLNTYNTNNNCDLATLCIMYDCVYGGYTKKDIESLDAIPEGSTITIANDASNMKRCLDILNAEGLITVDYGTTEAKDLNADNIASYITANPKNYVITPMNTNLIPESLNDTKTYLGIVNATFAINAGLGTSAKLLCEEKDPDHVNANIVAIQKKDLEADWAVALKNILVSAETDQFVKDTFGATIKPYHGA